MKIREDFGNELSEKGIKMVLNEVILPNSLGSAYLNSAVCDFK